MNSHSGKSAGPVVYVVDDEEPMVDFAKAALKQLACTVRTFTDPTEAYAALIKDSPKPTVLLTDFAMAPMDGLELSHKCKSAHPALRVLMVSGTIDEQAVRAATVLDGFLAKPYHATELAERVMGMLGVDCG